ncbi:hypothetical protein BDF14DRAFT_1880695 [Spinellus fusiger]|nr:hypothetical protein BDF14DRAFT_1880695 [Spinellus fusiger]
MHGDIDGSSLQASFLSFRHSLDVSQGPPLLGRRLSRTDQTHHHITENSYTHTHSSVSEPSQKVSMHVKIVPCIEDASRCIIFDIVDRQLEAGTVIKIGRLADRPNSLNYMSFKTKVVSRAHCEIWVGNDEKLYIRDTKSSSGTFINHIRLSPTGHESHPIEIKDGDIVQLGIDYQGGLEEMYRSVRMRFQVNRSQNSRPLSYSIAAFNQLRQYTGTHRQRLADTAENVPSVPFLNSPNVTPCDNHPNSTTATAEEQLAHKKSHEAEVSLKKPILESPETEECCICLYALAPFQALFVAPCAHSYHYKCIRPLLKSYPGFQCPICRSYADLEESVAIEVDQVAMALGLENTSHYSSDQSNSTCEPVAISISTTNEPSSNAFEDADSDSNREGCRGPPPVALSSLENGPSPAALTSVHPTPCLSTSQEREPLSSTLAAYSNAFPASLELHNTTRDRRTVYYEDSTQPITQELTIHAEPHPIPSIINTETPSSSRRPVDTHTQPTNLVEKLKMIFLDKRKSEFSRGQQRKINGRRKQPIEPRPLSYPTVMGRASTNEMIIHWPGTNLNERSLFSFAAVTPFTPSSTSSSSSSSGSSSGSSSRPTVHSSKSLRTNSTRALSNHISSTSRNVERTNHPLQRH